ncbi:MAG: class-II DAHP synthetase family-domain-containing protein [Olpidium bornovanus]|uniref:Phospho-2-dehydro-3-deoxyheptonate aldolase n=1 Tax=Olpidium bornovanus TaxID=278681 RepID=A0A8H7ZRV0_9FUNG|nr:MAG: class-II DAHP synthetase family-domain-containing protein [Olpidium bornovanus]
MACEQQQDEQQQQQQQMQKKKQQQKWSPTSWTTRPVLQDIKYGDREELASVLRKLQHLPPLVHPGEVRLVEKLREQLARVARGQAFLLQGGDCAELFDYCSQKPIEDKLKVLLQMSVVLTWGARTPVVRIARMAGQYAKPRSKPTELIDGKEVWSFRGSLGKFILMYQAAILLRLVTIETGLM